MRLFSSASQASAGNPEKVPTSNTCLQALPLMAKKNNKCLASKSTLPPSNKKGKCLVHCTKLKQWKVKLLKMVKIFLTSAQPQVRAHLK